MHGLTKGNVKVYHHCLFGVRYDFLCANYTAFDQTLFNCNFVSNVDCQNSKKFWHRNDELYITKSTTAAPLLYNFYTPPPQGSPLTASPSEVNSPGQLPALPPAQLEPIASRRVPVPRRQLPSRVRPQYDYYEEEYEELPRPKARKRRPRPRPIYYDDYGDYEDERYERRGGRRRSYNRRDRPVRRNNERRRHDYEDDYLVEDDDFVAGKRKEKRGRVVDEYEYADDRRGGRYDRRPTNRRAGNESRKNKRPIDDYDYEDYDRFDRRKSKEKSRNSDVRRVLNDKSEESKNIRLGKRRPPSEEYEDDLQQADEPKSYKARRGNKNVGTKTPGDGRPIIKPVSGTIYDRPRVAPRINLPVPKNAAEKFAYKQIGGGAPTTTVSAIKDEDFDEYDEEPLPKLTKDKKTTLENDSSKFSEEQTTKSLLIPNNKPKIEMNRNIESVLSNRKKSLIDNSGNEEKSNVPITTTTESIIDGPRPLIRKFKRPLLPNRSGSVPTKNPQPARTDTEDIILEESKKENINSKETTSSSIENPDATKNKVLFLTKLTTETPSKQVPVRIKVPVRVKSPILEEEPSKLKYKIVDSTTRGVQQPKLNEVDILNGNYDVTLNEAISPIIPNLPVRSFTSIGGVNDYTYKRFQRPTKYVILDPVVSAGSTYYVK